MRFLSRIYDSMLAPAGTFDPASALHDTAADRSVNAPNSVADNQTTGSSMTRFSHRGELVCRKTTSIAPASAAGSHLDTTHVLNPAISMANKKKGAA